MEVTKQIVLKKYEKITDEMAFRLKSPNSNLV